MRSFNFLGLDRTEAAFGLIGLSLATGSIIFAVGMVTAPDREPEIVGIEHLAIYAKPSRASQPRPGEPAAGVDYTPIGSTRRYAERILPGYEVLDAKPDGATIRSPEGRVIRVTPGARLAGVGGVASIHLRDGKWVIITQAGLIRER